MIPWGSLRAAAGTVATIASAVEPLVPLIPVALLALTRIGTTAHAGDFALSPDPARSPSEVIHEAARLDHRRVVVTGGLVQRSTWKSPRGAQYSVFNVADGRTGLQMYVAFAVSCNPGDTVSATGTFYRYRVVEGRTFYNSLDVGTIDCHRPGREP